MKPVLPSMFCLDAAIEVKKPNPVNNPFKLWKKLKQENQV